MNTRPDRAARSTTSVFVDNAGVRVHVLGNGQTSNLPPVLVVPGMGERADEYTWLLDELSDRRAAVVDVRGRGRSDAPPHGYSLDDHVADLRAAVDALALRDPILVAFSRGSSYALCYALRFPDRVRGVVVGDYHARHVGLPVEFADHQLRMRIRGSTVGERMPEHAVRRVVADSRDVPFWDRLDELRCPVLVLRGDRPSCIVTEELAERWRASLPSVEVATIAGAGHDLWSRDPDAYLTALRPFLERIGG